MREYIVAWAVVVVLYIAAAFTRSPHPGEHRLNPLVITAGVRGRASLSKLQIFVFTLIVVWMLTYYLLDKSVVTDLSGTVLVLLGVSAAGTVGSKLTATAAATRSRQRVSYANWSWLVKKRWITDDSIFPPRRPPKFGDLINSGGELDVSKFQNMAVSVVVAVAMAYVGYKAGTLAEFKIPDNVLGLLGLGQAVYLGGKAARVTTVKEFDEKLTELRELEAAFTKEVSDAWQANAPTNADMKTAINTATDAYNTYKASAGVAAVMLQAIKEDQGLVLDLEPALPHYAK